MHASPLPESRHLNVLDAVIPVQAGIHCLLQKPMDDRHSPSKSDSRFRGNDVAIISDALPSMAHQIHTVCKEFSS